MSYLPQFQFDVFLSYGWAGSNVPFSGDPSWVTELHLRLLEELRGNFRQISLYFDLERSLAGDVLENTLAASRSSAIFLFISTPDSEREASYCRDELRAFSEAEDARVGPAKSRTFVAQLRPFAPPPRPRPPEVDGIAAYRFFDSKTPYFKEDLRNCSTPAGREFARLVQAIVDSLNSLRACLRPYTTYIAYASRQHEQDVLRLGTEQTLANRYVLCPPSEVTKERDFVDACVNLIEASGLCVHIADREYLAVPSGWRRSPQCIQLADLALKRSSPVGGLRVLVWIDPEAQIPIDWREFSTPSSDVVMNTTFEEFTSIVSNGYRPEPHSPVAPQVLFSRILYIHCTKEEIRTIKPLLDHVRNKGLEIQLPYYDGRLSKRTALIQEAIRESHGSIIYFGRDHDINVGRIRDLINAVFDESRPSAPRALLLDPCDDEYRLQYRATRFQKIAHTAAIPPELDAFLDKVLSQ